MAKAVYTGSPLPGELGMLLKDELCLLISSHERRKRPKLFKKEKIATTKEHWMGSNLWLDCESSPRNITFEVNIHAQKQRDNEDHPSQCPAHKTSFFHYLLNIFSILILKFLSYHSIICRFLVLVSAKGFCFFTVSSSAVRTAFFETLSGVLSWKVISMGRLWGFFFFPQSLDQFLH